MEPRISSRAPWLGRLVLMNTLVVAPRELVAELEAELVAELVAGLELIDGPQWQPQRKVYK